MGNSLTGINNDILLNEALEAFQDVLLNVSRFSYDVSSAAANKGDRVSVPRIPSHGTATAFSAQYTINDATVDAIEVILTGDMFVSWGLTDTQVANSSVLSLQRVARGKGTALGLAVVQDILSALTTTNYGAPVWTGTAGAMDVDDLFDIRNACNAALMPKMERWLALDSDFTTALMKDNGVQQVHAFGSDQALRRGTLPPIAGFEIQESDIIPANGADLVGFVAHPGGLAVASRYLKPLDSTNTVKAMAMTDPNTGLTIGYREWYSPATRQINAVIECLYGFALGITNGIKLIVSG